MKGIYLKVLFAFISLLVVSCSTRSSLEVDGLQCENLNEPLGIDNTSPHFSWVLNSKEQGAEQTAYQILVASDKKYLSEGKADLWNSGKMESDKSNGILYQGRPLSSRSFSYWKVRVWDGEGNVSAWSEPACFGVGLLHPEDWTARYIGMNQA